MKTPESSAPAKRRAKTEKATKASCGQPAAAISADILADYSRLDWSKAVRGKHFNAFQKHYRAVPLEADLVGAFSSTADVNAALRSLVEAARHLKPAH